MLYVVLGVNIENLDCNKPTEAKQKLTYKLQVMLCEDSRRFYEQDGHGMTLKQIGLRFIRADFETDLSKLKSYNQQ